MNRGRGAFLIAHNRQAFLDRAIAAIRPQVDTVMVLDNASKPRMTVPDGVGSMYVPDQPPNLARWWNIGFDFFKTWYKDRPYDLAVLCDDAIAPDDWFEAVTQAMRNTGAAIGCSNPWGVAHEPRVKIEPDRDIVGRMPGWAWVVDGQRLLRADERLHWWYLDTKLDWDARRMGGMVMIGGYPVPNEQPNYFTVTKPDLNEQAGRDGQMFAQIEGWCPW